MEDQQLSNEPCSYGMNCPNLLNCEFIHVKSDEQPKALNPETPSDLQPGKGKIPKEGKNKNKNCFDGKNCNKVGCKFKHPKQNPGDRVSTTSGSNKSRQQKCKFDLNCEKADCIKIHSTKSTHSLAFELLVMINPYKVPDFIVKPKIIQEEEKVEQPSPIQEYEFPYKDFLKNFFKLQGILSKIQSDHSNILISFDLSQKDTLKFKLDQSHETWEKVKELITDNLVTKKVHPLHRKDIDPKKFEAQFKQECAKELKDLKVKIEGCNEKSKRNNRGGRRQDQSDGAPVVVLYSLNNQKDQLDKVKQLLNKFHKETFTSEHNLFIDSNKLSAQERFLKYNYIRRTNVFNDILTSNDLAHVKLNFDNNDHKIKAHLTSKQFQAIKDSLTNLINSVQIIDLHIISCLRVHETKLHDDKTLAQRAEQKFKVKVTPDLYIRESNGNSSRGSKSKEENKYSKTSVSFRRTRFPLKVQECTYDIIITGEEALQAQQYLIDQISQYKLKNEKLPFIKNQAIFEEVKSKIPEIAKENKVIIKYDNDDKKYALLGKGKDNRLNDAWNEILEICKPQKQQRKAVRMIQFPEAPNHILNNLIRSKLENIHQIEKQHSVEIKFDKFRLTIKGFDDKLNSAYPAVHQLVLEQIDNIKTEIISDPNLLKALNMMKQKNIGLEKFNVKIKMDKKEHAQKAVESQKENKQFIDNQSKLPPLKLNSSIESSIIKGQWSYKVYKADPNYDQRTDKVNDWFDFDSDQNFQIETHYKACCQSQGFNQRQPITGDQGQIKNGFTYEVYGADSNPLSWVEENLQTKRKRQLTRREIQTEEEKKFEMVVQESKMRAFPDDDNDEDDYQNQKDDDYVMTVTGLKTDIANLIEFLQSFYNDPKNHNEIMGFDQLQISNILIKELIKLVESKFQVNIEDSNNKLKIQGFKCKEAKQEILKLAEKTRNFQFPQNWEDTLELFNKSLIIKDLNKDSQEYLGIVQQFKQTMGQANILKIQRIQNKYLWKIYQTEMENMTDRNGSKPAEKYLYHGSRGTDPSQIYNGSEGFDMRFSSGGMWGQAVYFAQNASYSNSYRSTTPQGTHQMFFARVLVGNHKELASNGSLKMPPLIEGSQTKRYDSVKGQTGGSDVYMIYTNKQAYPEYLITYQ